MTRDLSTIYDPQFFESYNAEQEADIRFAADVLYDIFRPKWAVDFGCGPGMLVRRLTKLGVIAVGFDGSSHAIEKAHETIRNSLAVCNIVANTSAVGDFNLVVCTEVAEHIPAEDADALVRTLCNACSIRDGAIVFTAAPPGQGGHDHINEQPMSYWIEKFGACGLDVDETLTAAVKSGWHGLKRMWFYPANVRVFNRIVR